MYTRSRSRRQLFLINKSQLHCKEITEEIIGWDGLDRDVPALSMGLDEVTS